MCIWSTIIYQYIWKMLLTYQYFSFESVHGEAMLKMGWVVKKWNFSFLTAINWSKCILMVSVYIWLSIYTNKTILCIIWKFDLSSRGVLGRIYALSIEVLYPTISGTFQTVGSSPVARSDARPPGMRTVEGSILGSGNILSLRLVMKSFRQPFSPYRWFK